MDGAADKLDFSHRREFRSDVMSDPQQSVVPSFFLYGDPPREVGDRFLHLESLDDRSRPSEWNIRAHAHANLNHLFFIGAGAGEMRAEGEVFAFEAPALLLVPARAIHAFSWREETAGSVLTIADSYLQELLAREPLFRLLFVAPLGLALDAGSPEASAFEAGLAALSQELSWRAPGQMAAIEAQLLGLLVVALRRQQGSRAASAAPGAQAELVARFRQLLETDFRRNLPLEAYARRLGVSLPRLRTACLKVTREPPLKLLQARLLLEAKRLLLYSNITVTEAAYALGFADPAYFSRFFQQKAGESPRAYRLRHFSRDDAPR